MKKTRKSQIEGLRKKANHNIRKILRSLGFRGVDQGYRLVGCCPIPHENSKTPNDNRTAFNWLYDRGIWACFSNHCEQAYGRDIFALVRCVKGFSGKDGFNKAVEYICNILDVNYDSIEEVSDKEIAEMQKIIRKRSELKKHQSIEEDMLTHLEPCDYLVRDRGFSIEVVNEFKADGCWKKYGTLGYNRLIIPVYDPIDDYLIGFTGRTLLSSNELARYKNDGKHIAKWLHCRNFAMMPSEAENDKFHAAHVLFNLHRAKHFMGDHKTIILTEGPLDTMRLWEASAKNAVSVFGTNFSQQQKELLHRVGVQRLISTFDSDEAGNKAHDRLVNMCGKYFDIQRIDLPKGKDPGDLEPIELRFLFREYINE